MGINTCEEFLGVLHKSALLDAARLEEARRLVKGLDEPTAAARKLVQQNFLSRWQAQQLLAGRHTLLISKYRLLDLLGNDAVGPSYLAEHKQMDRRVVLKALARREGNNSAAVEKFLSETATLATLDHRHLSHIYDVDHEGDFYYLVMEHVQGRNLQQVVDTDGPLGPEAAAGLVALAADAIQHAHQQGVLHLGLRPDRLMVDGQGMLKVLDIGVARLADRDSPDGSAIQRRDTLAYRAPEQRAGSRIPDARADVYALGAVLYLLLTGEHPPAAGESGSSDPRRKRANVPAELAQICQKMMAPEPQDRYASAELAADTLKDWLARVESLRAAARSKAAAPKPRTGVDVREAAPIFGGQARPSTPSRPPAAVASGPHAIVLRKSADQRKLMIGVGSGVVLAAIVAVAALLLRGNGPAKPVTDSTPVPAAPVKPRGNEQVVVDHPPPIENSDPMDQSDPGVTAGTSALPVLAYWRFENPTEDESKPEGRKPAVSDDSDSSNHLFVPEGSQPVRFSTMVSAPQVRATGVKNLQSLDDTQAAASGDGAAWGLATVASRQPRDLAATKLNTWTVEASFFVEQLGFSHTIVGKDGPPKDGSRAPLQLRVRGDNDHIEIEAIDSTGAPRSVESTAPVVPGRWYHVAAASNGQQLRLWVDNGDGGGVELQGGAPFKGALAEGPGEWSVGRGFSSGKPADDALMLIDEVRITAADLELPQMLMHATPEQLAAEKVAATKATTAAAAPAGKIQFHPLEIIQIEGPEGVEFQPQEDGSFLVQGANPDKAVYTIKARTKLTGIRGFRLEALADSRLPGRGPGRYSGKESGNYCLSALHVSASVRQAEPRPAQVTWAKATADFSQKNYDIQAVIDKDPKGGWAIAPATGKGHYALLHADRPLGYPQGTWLTIQLEQNLGKQLTLGRFRLTAFTGTEPGEDPAAGVLASDRLADPLGKVPPRVALPTLPAEGESATDETTTAVTLATVYSSSAAPVDLSLLGGESAFATEGNRFRLEPDIKDGSRRWRFLLHMAEAAASEPVMVAEAAIVGYELKFRWTRQGASTPLSNQLRNCVLNISVGQQSRGMALRQPVVLPRLELGFVNSAKALRADIPWLPSVERVKCSIPADQSGLPTYVVVPEDIPASKGKLEITFGETNQPVLIAVVDAALKKSLVFTVDLYYQPTAEAKRIVYQRSKLDRLKVKLNSDISRGQVQAGRLPEPAKQNLQKQINEVQAALKSLGGMLEMADTIDQAGGLAVQVYTELGDQRVLLGESSVP